LPFVLVANKVFPLTTFMMKLYPQNNLDKKIFNCRLSHASSIEYTFGIFATGWRIYGKFIIASVFTAQKIIQTIMLCIIM